MIDIKPGTKVTVYSKSTGCPLSHLFERKSKRYPSSVPFTAWVSKMHSSKHNQYVIVYEKDGVGGDYYRREDFGIDESLDFFGDGDFLI